MDGKRDVLLHFTSLKYAALIISGQAMRLGDFSHSNDIYEDLRRFYAQPLIVDRSVRPDYKGSFSERARLIDSSGDIRFLSFCKAEALPANELGDAWYVQSPRLAFQKMWGQYADKFGGACLIFDRARLENSGRQWLEKWKHVGAEFAAYDVEYLSHVLSIRALSALSQLSDFHNLQQFFSKKHNDWEDEQEFRLLFRVPPDSINYLSVCDSLIGVRLGEKNNPNLRDEVYGESDQSFVRLLIEKIQADLGRFFSNFDVMDVYHFPDDGPYPMSFKELKMGIGDDK